MHLFARSLKRRCYQQMSGSGDRSAEHDERLASRCVCNGEHRQEGLAESAATCQTCSSIWAVKVQMSSPNEDTWATQGGGVTSAILPAGPHRLRQPVLTWQLWPEYLAAGNSSTKCGESLMVVTGWRVSGGGGGTESVSSHPSPHASGAGGLAAPQRVKDV